MIQISERNRSNVLFDLEQQVVIGDLDHSTGECRAVAQVHFYQSRRCTTPVTLLRQWPLDPRRADLENERTRQN